ATRKKISRPVSVSSRRIRIVAEYRSQALRMHQGPSRKGNLEQKANHSRWWGQPGTETRRNKGGHHWQIADGGFLAEWWPSSAKLVIGKKWHDGIHCHDYKQALKVIEDFYRKKRHRLASRA